MKRFSKLKIVFTSYGPFASIKVNPTKEVVDNIMKEKSKIESDKVKIFEGECFTVTTKYIDEHAKILFDEIKAEADKNPDTMFITIHYGLANSRKMINPEKRAINYIHDEYKSQIIEPDYPKEYRYVKIDTKKIVENLIGRGIKTYESDDAGTYLCNYLLYFSLKSFEKIENAYSEFIHIPSLENVSIQKNVEFIKCFINELESLYL